MDYCIGLRVMIEYYGRGVAPDVPITRFGPCRLQPLVMCAYRQASVQALAIGIGILLHRAMNVRLILWLDMAHT